MNQDAPVALFFRIIEQSDGRWACQHGRLRFDAHNLLDDAIEHISAVAKEHAQAAEIYLHRLNGAVHLIGTV